MILVVSAGRSGSGWLCTVFSALGLKTSHEWFPAYDSYDAIADTSWIWDQPTFWQNVQPEDTLIILDRKEKDRIKSVNNLIGPKNWNRLNTLWKQFVQTASEGVHPNTHFFSYENLFNNETRDKVRHLLFAAGHDTSNLDNFWSFARNMKITNKTAETGVKESYASAK